MEGTDVKVELFLDFEVDGHRVIIFPSWLKASLIGHPEPSDQSASVRWLDNQPPVYTTDNPLESAKRLLSGHLSGSLERRI